MLNQPIYILLIDDNPGDRLLAHRELARALPNISVHEIINAAMLEQALTEGMYHAVITDYHLQWSTGQQVLQLVKDRDPFCPVIMFTATGTQEVAVEAMKSGLDDYVIKAPRHFVRLPAALHAALERSALRRRHAELELEREQLLQREHTARLAAEAAQQRLTFLAEASQILSTTLDYTSVLTKLARLTIPHLADYCIVDVLEDGNLRQLAVAHIDPSKEQVIRDLRARYPFRPDGNFGVGRVVATGASEMEPVLDDAWIERVSRDADHQRLLEHIHPHSYIIVPMRVQNEILGALSLVRNTPAHPYTNVDLRLAEDLARQAALHVANARLYHQAQQAIKLRDEFLMIASHELKTPLTAVIGYTNLLQRTAAKQDTMAVLSSRLLSPLMDQALRLDRLISDMLDIGRINAGVFTLQRQPLNVCETVQHMLGGLQPLLVEHNLEFQCSAPELMIEGDPLRLDQVLHNLVQNAVKYSLSNSTIRVSITQRENNACIAVTDQGMGIPEAAQPHIFEQFYRASNVNPINISGFGIGLFIAHQIVARHGGTLEVESQEGVGSTFTVCLPALKLQQPA